MLKSERDARVPGKARVSLMMESHCNSNKSGHQKKTVTLVANTVPNTMLLVIEGDVLAPETQKTAQ